MHKHTIGLPGLLMILLLFNGCMPDDELSAPVNVNLYVVMGTNTPGINYVDFHNIAIAVQQIKFYGVRQEGSDIFFNSQPNAPYGIYAIRKDQSPPLINAFDIPQGVYNQMRWEIQTREIDDDYYEDYFDEELDEFIDVDDFGIIIEGKYTKLDGTQILLFIAIDPIEILLMETFDTGGNNQLSLLSGQSYNVRLEINPYVAIENIERSLLENAETDEEDDIYFIEISSDENEDLYERILFRLKNTVRAIIEEQ
ncbi:MAG: hypothetical protein EA393_13290 [Bacteroidetes bacterium]|nr:MAG: hypothetical protein EA393_13290 [Bacteroidota bacterium]